MHVTVKYKDSRQDKEFSNVNFISQMLDGWRIKLEYSKESYFISRSELQEMVVINE